jgi:hypothetical protein
MFLRISHPVQKLRRVGIGPLRDPDLPLGSVRELKPREVEMLLRSSREKAKAKTKKPAKKAGKKVGAGLAPAREGVNPAPTSRTTGVKRSKPAAKKPAARKKAAAKRPAPKKTSR